MTIGYFMIATLWFILMGWVAVPIIRMRGEASYFTIVLGAAFLSLCWPVLLAGRIVDWLEDKTNDFDE